MSYRAMIGAMRRRARAGRSMPFALTWDDEMVGQLTVNGISWGSARWASLGYWVAQSHAGRGITTTGVALVCDHLFAQLQLHRVEIAIRPENAASTLAFSVVVLANIVDIRVAEDPQRQLTHASLSEVGRAFGGKDHTTVLHAVDKIQRQLQKAARWGKEQLLPDMPLVARLVRPYPPIS